MVGKALLLRNFLLNGSFYGIFWLYETVFKIAVDNVKQGFSSLSDELLELYLRYIISTGSKEEVDIDGRRESDTRTSMSSSIKFNGQTGKTYLSSI